MTIDTTQFRTWLKGRGKASRTVESYCYYIGRIKERALATPELTQDAIENCGMSGSTQNAMFSAASAWFRFTTGKKQKFFEFAKIRESNRKPPTPGELKKLMAVLYQKHLLIHDMVWLSCETGMRHSLVLNMKKGWIDFSAKQINIPAKVEGNKAKKKFFTFFKDDIKDMLEKRTRTEENNENVFHIKQKSKIGYVNYWLKIYCKEAGIDYYSFHCFRYYYASNYPGDISVGTQLMGQSDPKQFMRYNKKHIAEMRKDYEGVKQSASESWLTRNLAAPPLETVLNEINRRGC